MKVRIILKNTKVLKRGMCVGILSINRPKRVGWDVLYESGTNVLYLEFDNVVYFLKDYVRITFFGCKDIGGNRSERCVVQEIYCNNNSAYTIL